MLKYVRFVHDSEGIVFAFTLPPLRHLDLANAMRGQGYRPESAGFVHFGPACGITTHGESTSLRLKPMADDAHRISAFYAIAGAQVRSDAQQRTDGITIAGVERTTWNETGTGYMRADFKATIYDERNGWWAWRAYAHVIQSAHGRSQSVKQAMDEADASLNASAAADAISGS